ncbi:MAG: hypothetical protein IJB10_05160 [Clostridia bacterium]|nr:hypothetical protein [Clostridia bacterium]
MSRILARDCGFKMVFQYLFSEQTEVEKIIEEFELTEEEKNFSISIFSAVKNNFEDLKTKLNANLKNNLTVKDIYKLDYAIILVAMASIDYLEQAMSLSVNEAVELAKKYSTEKSPSFVNGVLSSIYKQNK